MYLRRSLHHYEYECGLQTLTFHLDGQEHTVALGQWGEAAASQDSCRAAAMVNLSPVNSYLFSSDGNLLYANDQGVVKIKKSGEIFHTCCVGPCTSQVLFENEALMALIWPSVPGLAMKAS